MITSSEKIKVGLIRCDMHGIWFAALMAEHDPKLLQRPMPPEEPQHYSWQAGGCHEFFYTNYANPLDMTAPFVGGFEITQLWDEHRDAAEMASRVFLGKPRVCDTFEEVSDDVDLVFVADCNYDGSDHLELASPGLGKGVATFVDKPFADSVANARAMMTLARRHQAPLFSLSIVRAEPYIARFRNRLPEAGEVAFATIQGYGIHPRGLVHTVSMAQHVFGAGIQTVRTLDCGRQISVHLDWGERPDRPKFGLTINTNVGPRPYTSLGVSVYGSREDLHVNIPGDLVYPQGTAEIIKMLAQMVRTRNVPPLMDEVVESIAVIEAAQKSLRTGRPVHVAEFLNPSVKVEVHPHGLRVEAGSVGS